MKSVRMSSANAVNSAWMTSITGPDAWEACDLFLVEDYSYSLHSWIT